MRISIIFEKSSGYKNCLKVSLFIRVKYFWTDNHQHPQKEVVKKTQLVYSEHAFKRMAQRGIHREDIEYVYEHGHRVYSGGVLHLFLRKKDIPKVDRGKSNARKLEGTTVLLSSDENAEVITAYRNKQALPQLRRKQKYANVLR
jgi:hypothetical protein